MGVFPGKMWSDHCKNHSYRDRKNQKALALPHLASAPLPSAANSSDVPTEFAAEHNKDEVLEGKFCNLNFQPSTKKNH